MVSCVVCGLSFQRKRTNGRAVKYCSKGCFRHSERIRAAASRGSKVVHECLWCEAKWSNINGGKRSRFCSLAHKNEWQKREKRREYGATVRVVSCSECDAEFETTQPRQVVCGLKCRAGRKMRMKAPRKGWFVAREALKAEIRERDQGLCGLCGDPVPSELPLMPSGRVQDDHPSLDHVVPRSLGGSDEPSNLQLTHWKCNVLKGASTNGRFLPKAG